MRLSALRHTQITFAFVAVIALALVMPASAGIVAGSVLVGEFSDPVLQGSIIPLAGQPSYYDNTSSAVYSVSNSTDPTLVGTPPVQHTGSQLNWGVLPGTTPDFSSLVFFGRPIPADPSQPFDLGTIEFTNGTSQLTSLIFGATLNFYATTDGQVLDAVGSSAINIVTTANLGVAGSEPHDADFVSFSGIANKTLNVFEGAVGSAELYGYIVGDPVLVLTDIVLNPGQSNSAFIGNGQPPAPTPEPSALVMAAIGTLGCLGYAWRRRRATIPA
jgi:hypothetical protein